MKSTQTLLLGALLMTALYGCNCTDPNAGNDGGVDVEDAGFDAGEPPDAGTPVDAGDPDAGPPPELKINKVLPSRGPTSGGVQVTLDGSGFIRGFAQRATEATKKTTVKFGSNVAQDIQVIDDTTLDVKIPTGKAGLANISIENGNGLFVCEACFTYFEELFTKSATPKEGPLRGGTEVTITGGGFTSEVQVLFGKLSSPQVTVVSSKELKVLSPRANGTGPVDLTVYSKNGVGVLRNVFRYYDDLRVGGVTPNTGPIAGGTVLTLVGKGFLGTSSVKFNGVEATSFSVDDASTLTVVTPAAPNGISAATITLTTPRDTWQVKDAFAWVDGSQCGVAGIYPHLGPAAGGNTVTVMGQGLNDPSVTVTVGGAPVATDSSTANELTFTAPPRGSSARKVQVVVQHPTCNNLIHTYTYGIALSAIAPDRGPITGGTAATVTGVELPADALVNVGALEATVTGAPAETSLSLMTPKGQGGEATDVWVREAADPENEAILENSFTFDEALSMGRVQPDRGAIAGGTLVSVLGSGFGEGTIVRFGKHVAKDIKVVDVHTLTVRTPKAEGVETVEVKVERAGQSDTLQGGFSYYDPRSLSGGLSGGPLTGTLNITVLDSSPGSYGLPVQLATVLLGTDQFTPYQGLTDHRGQITFSDAALVKAQTVTAIKDGYESATVTNVNAENLTVFMARTGGDGSPAPPPPGAPPSIISGHVTGFKAPRPLGPNESLEARVFIAQGSLFAGAPYQNPPNRQGQKWQVTKEGGEYLLATRAGLRAVYAIFGVANSQAMSFEPYLMGVKRGITVTADQPATNEDIILDMHLDVTVPVTIDGPLSIDGMPALNELYAWMDLGAEGFIPNPNNWQAGTGSGSSISSTQPMLNFPHFPQLDGSNFIFMNASYSPMSGLPQSVYFRRQPGDMTKGVTVGPMLPTNELLTPSSAQPFAGTIAWVTDPGPSADIHQVKVLKPTLFGMVTLWSIVLPGTESQVTLPPAAVAKLQQEEAGTTLYVQILSSRSPKFAYNQWTYETLSGVSWSSYTVALSDPFTP